MPQTFLFIFAAEVTCRQEHHFKSQLWHILVCDNRTKPCLSLPFCLTGSLREQEGGRGAPALPSVLSLLWAQTWSSSTWAEASPAEQRVNAWGRSSGLLYLAFLGKFRGGRRCFITFFFNLFACWQCKFGHVLRLQSQLLSWKGVNSQSFLLSHHSHFTHTSKSSVCRAEQHSRLVAVSVLHNLAPPWGWKEIAAHHPLLGHISFCCLGGSFFSLPC